MNALALSFNDVSFDIIDRNNQPWLRSPQIGDALGYKKGRVSIDKIYKANAEEFTDSMTALVELETAGGKQQVRIFSLRGCHLLAMFARTAVAKEFRKWVLDILDQYTQPTPTEPPRLTHATKEQREPLVNAVRRLVKVAQSKNRPITYDQAHSIINLKMGVSGIDDMTPEQIPQAMTLVGDLLEKIVLEGEYLAKPDTADNKPAPSHTFQHVPLDQITSRFDVFFRNDPYWSQLSKMSMIVITSVAWNTLRGTLNDDDLCFLNSAMSHLTIPRAHPLDGLVGRVVDALEKQPLR